MAKSAPTAVAVIALVAFAASAHAQAPIIPQPVPQVVPQFNNPGPQIPIAKPGNQLEQLSPIESVRPRPGYVAPYSSLIRTKPIKSRQSSPSPHRHWYSICSNDDCSEPASRARTARRHSSR
jgi:hypothetical protein